MLRASYLLVGVTKSLVARSVPTRATLGTSSVVFFDAPSLIVSTVMCRLLLRCDDVCCGNTIVGPGPWKRFPFLLTLALKDKLFFILL